MITVIILWCDNNKRLLGVEQLCFSVPDVALFHCLIFHFCIFRAPLMYTHSVLSMSHCCRAGCSHRSGWPGFHWTTFWLDLKKIPLEASELELQSESNEIGNNHLQTSVSWCDVTGSKLFSQFGMRIQLFSHRASGAVLLFVHTQVFVLCMWSCHHLECPVHTKAPTPGLGSRIVY